MENCIAITENDPQKMPTVKVYKRRFWMQCLFSLSSMMSGMLFPQYIVMAQANSCFYGVSLEAINWTGMLQMFVYLALNFPMSYLIRKYLDLRWTVVGTALLNLTASGFQFATAAPGAFGYVMVSTFFASLGNLFVLGIPPFLAARWFPSHELSRACAFGVFGNQLGIALGFLLSPLVVSSDCSHKDLMSTGKLNVAIILTGANLILFLLIAFTFQNAPKLPPSISEAEKKMEPDIPYKEVVLSMLKNKDFILIFIIYGFMVGSYFSLCSTLNVLILEYFPHREKEIGWMGLLLTVSGLVGSLIAGWILDCTKKFKETVCSICVASLITYVVFGICLYVHQIWVQFVTIAVLGFFLTSFLAIGFEYGIEVTYPQPEVICACLMNASTMFFGIVITEMISHIMESEGTVASNAALTVTLLLCCVISSFLSKDYKRSKKNADIQTNVSEKNDSYLKYNRH